MSREHITDIEVNQQLVSDSSDLFDTIEETTYDPHMKQKQQAQLSRVTK